MTILPLICAAAAPEPPIVTAAAAILVDSTTGTILYEKACHARRPPASTTKIMTAILALERGNLEDVVTASEHASKTPFGSLHVKPGEKLTLGDLLYALLMRSANDAAVCIAEHIAGSEEAFVAMMNEKAAAVGAKDTRFRNPHGLHADGHYSTAYDLALMARYAAAIPHFNEMVCTKNYRISRSISKLDVTLRNTGRLLWRFDGADGIKTGYTKQAGHCFVGSATRDDWRLIAVVLKSTNCLDDTCTLLDYGFKHHKLVCFAREGLVATRMPVRGGVESAVDLVAAESLGKVVRAGDRVTVRHELDGQRATAPLADGERVCMLTGYVNGVEVGSVPLVAACAVDRTFAYLVWIWMRNLLVASAILLAVYFSYGTAVAEASRRRRRRLSAGG